MKLSINLHYSLRPPPIYLIIHKTLIQNEK